MKTTRRTIAIILIVLTSFLSLTGMAGGIALVAQYNTPPLEQLNGSVFKDFTIPGIVLTIFVGGSALTAALLLIRKNVLAPLFANLAGIIIMSFEFVEVLVIGSPEGIARSLQIFYFSNGVIISALSAGIWLIDLQVQKRNL